VVIDAVKPDIKANPEAPVSRVPRLTPRVSREMPVGPPGTSGPHHASQRSRLWEWSDDPGGARVPILRPCNGIPWGPDTLP
jgi:hypothetical protein